jgi:hypothetical protein
VRLAKLADGSSVTVLPSELSVTVASTVAVDPDLTSVKVEVVTVALSISSEKVALTLVARLTSVYPLEGLLLTAGTQEVRFERVAAHLWVR